MKYEPKLPGEPVAGVAAGVMYTSSVFAGFSYLLFKIPYPVRLDYYLYHVKGWAAVRAHQINPSFAMDSALEYGDYLQQLPSTWPLLINAKFDLAVLVGLVAGGLLAFYTGRDKPSVFHVTGRRLHWGKNALRNVRRIFAAKCSREGRGLRMHPSFKWCLSLLQETSHAILMGGVGTGKTQIIAPWIQAASARGDRMVIFDNKGDFTRWLPKLVLLAPWDARSYVWDIARDCVSSQDAHELAARLIKEGNDPIWHLAARQTLASVIMELQTTQPGTWDWHALYKLGCSSQPELMEIVSRHLPEARHLFESPGKTTQSVLINFGSQLTLIGSLAKAWYNTPSEKRFSFTKWLHDENTRDRTIVLQGSGEYAELARAYIGSIVMLLSARINSPSFEESKTRRIWVFLDEFAQLGKLNDFAPLLEIGRSKGIGVVLGAQDFEQVREIYGEHVANSWMSMVGMHIITKVNSGETANFLAEEVIGERVIERISMFEGKPQPARRERELVLEPNQLSDCLGPNGTGVRALLLQGGEAFVLDWPFTDLPTQRKPSIPAHWLTAKEAVKVENRGETVIVSKSKSSPAPVSRLRLRPLSPGELTAMAESGTNTNDAADEKVDLTDNAAGGSHESR